MNRVEEIQKMADKVIYKPGEEKLDCEVYAYASGFETGAKWADEHPTSSPWHNYEEESPKEQNWYFVRFMADDKLRFEVAFFDLTHGWLCETEYGENTVLNWMEIPQIPDE